MKTRQDKIHGPIKVRIRYGYVITAIVPPDKTPDEVWGTIDLGNLDKGLKSGNILNHDFGEASKFYYDNSNVEYQDHYLEEIDETMTGIEIQKEFDKEQ